MRKMFLYCIAFFLAAIQNIYSEPISVKGWELTYTDKKLNDFAKLPTDQWKPVNVPGNIQTSPFGLSLDELYLGTNVNKVAWMEKYTWVYRTTVKVPSKAKDEIVRMRFEGLDYYYKIFINSKLIVAGEGMFSPVDINLDEYAGKTVKVYVVFDRIPKNRSEYKSLAKAKFNSGWDFVCKLNTAGIWDEVHIDVLSRLRVDDLFVETHLQNKQRALVTVNAEFSEKIETGTAIIELCGQTRRMTLINSARISVPVEVYDPELWWPNGLGDQTMHNCRITLDVPGRKTEVFNQRVGLREVNRVPAQGQNNRDIPLQFVINGVPFFINGLNWVPPDACPGEISNDHYDRILPQFKDGNINLLRVWGGGICEKPYFYNRCDELGILILQEYPIACGLGMSHDQHYLGILQSEAKAIAVKLRKHPSVFLFCGGNENYHYWDMLDSDNPKVKEAADDVRSWSGQNRDWLFGASDRYEEPVHILLGAITAENAPGCLYQNTSAMEGEGEAHGPWTWNLAIGDHRYRGYNSFYDFWVNANQHLYSECSVSSIANLETIHHVLGNNEFDKIPAWDDSVWILHHAFYAAWSNFRDNWLDLPSTENVFGKIENLSDLVKANQYLQSEGGRYIVETLRRKQGHVTGLIWWGANEPWPSLAGNVLIDYYGRPKTSWPVIANAFSPTILSLEYGELKPRALKGDLWLCCNDLKGFSGNYTVRVKSSDGSIDENYTGRCSIVYGESARVGNIRRTPIPDGEALTVQVKLLRDKNSEPVYENTYCFGNVRKFLLGN